MAVRRRFLFFSRTSLISLVLLLLLVPSLLLNASLYRKLMSSPASGIPVLGVIDGDTLVLTGKVRLRLRGIDAPELAFCGGAEAKQALESLVSDQRVVVTEQIIDQLGRPMGLVTVGDTLVNETILQQGWGRFHSDDTSAREALKTAYETAKAQSLGIWSPACRQTENTENPECRIKGNIDPQGGRKVYYVPGCVQYKTAVVEKDRGEQWFCSEKDAVAAGYQKSQRCP